MQDKYEEIMLKESERDQFNLTLQAIEKGVPLGRGLMIEKINDQVESVGISYQYRGSPDYIPPDLGGDSVARSCPWAEKPKEGKKEDKGNEVFNCRALIDLARIEAEAMAQTVFEENPLGEEFGEGEERKEHEFWFKKSIRAGIDVEGIFALRIMRMEKACDTHLVPYRNPFERGREVGRQLLIEKINARLQELGIDFSYPDGTNIPNKQTRYCRAGIVQPAVQAAKANISEILIKKPLCSDTSAFNPDQLAYYEKAKKEYEKGISEGIREEESLAGDRLRKARTCVGSPIVLDIEGDGISFVSHIRGPLFDLSNLGSPVKTGWIQGDDALLVFDRNGNGIIESGAELFGNHTSNSQGNSYENGYLALGFYDKKSQGGNEDGMIDRADQIFDKLQLWQDQNQDGISQPEELYSLPALGVKSISLDFEAISVQDIFGNEVRFKSFFYRTSSWAEAKGIKGETQDVWFRFHSPEN
jgi:hypothetical protein